MGAIREVAHLETGIPIGPAVYFEAILRPATLADTYRATEAVPVPDDLTHQAARIAYQVQVDDALVLCQIEALGPLEGAELPGPAELAQVPGPAELAQVLDPDDMAVLRAAAAAVKKKLQLSRRNLPTFGAPSASSSAAASA